MEKLPAKIKEAQRYIEDSVDFEPQYGIVLGTGLGNLAEKIDAVKALDYEDIPHFPHSTVQSHSGKLVFGNLEGKRVVAMQGRFHYYEGWTMQELTFPIRVLKYLGIEALFLSNACGSLNPDLLVGDLMIINDHINMLWANPLRGKNYEELGPRFPDMSEPYDRDLIKRAKNIADEHDIKAPTGVYVSVQGPNLETRAEYRYLRIIGGDVVGMSTVPEAIVARHMKLPAFAVSVVTDEGFHEELEEVTIDDVVAAANEAEPNVTKLFSELIKSL